VSAVDSDSADLSAAVTPNGAPTSVTATCTGGAWQAGGATAGAGTTASTVTIPLTGLTGATAYTCAIQAKNSAGVTTSPGTVTFTTAGQTKTTARMTIQAKAFNAKKGKSATYTVATFTDPADAPAKEYTATIAWGDGTTSKGTVTKTGKGTYKVTGKHTYKTSGQKTTKVTVAKAGFPGVTAKGRATSG
jgi:hypothetical protein